MNTICPAIVIDRVGDETSLPSFRFENAKSQPLAGFYMGRRCVLTFLAHERPSNRTTFWKWWCFSFSRHCNIAGREKEYTRALIIPTLVCDVGNYVLRVASILLDPADAFCSVILDVEQPFFLFTVRRKLLSYLGDNKDNGSVISLILKIICCRYSNFLVFLCIKGFGICKSKYSR